MNLERRGRKAIRRYGWKLHKHLEWLAEQHPGLFREDSPYAHSRQQPVPWCRGSSWYRYLSPQRCEYPSLCSCGELDPQELARLLGIILGKLLWFRDRKFPVRTPA